jgi:hypothetical protein
MMNRRGKKQKMYFKHSKLPLTAAFSNVLIPHAHPFWCAYLRHSKYPPAAAFAHVFGSQAQPFS